jgi:hypothetical protein
MIINTNSDIWENLFFSMRNYLLNSDSWTKGDLGDRKTYEDLFIANGIHVIYSHYPNVDNFWEFVELPDGDEFTHLLLKWG